MPASGMVLDLASVDFWVEVRCGVTINCPDVSVDDDHLGLVCWSLGGLPDVWLSLSFGPGCEFPSGREKW